MSLPLLPLKPASTSGALDDPDVVGLIVEQVAKGDVPGACRLAARWCGLTNERRAQCNANSGLLWKQLTGIVFPTARAPTPGWLGANVARPSHAVLDKEWFYNLCKQIKAMKERRDDYTFAKWKASAAPSWDRDYEWNLDGWNDRQRDWIRYHRMLAKLGEKVRDAGHEYPQDVAERKSLLENIRITTMTMNRTTKKMKKRDQLVLTTKMRFKVQQEHMADLFQLRKPEVEPDVAKANEAWSRERLALNARLQSAFGREVAEMRDAAQRFAVVRDSKDPREAELTALVHAAEGILYTSPMNATYASYDSPEQAELRLALNDVKYARYTGSTFRLAGEGMNELKLELERALAPLRD